MSFLSHHGALGLFLAMFLESSAFPIPSEAILPFGGYLVSRHSLPFLHALLAAAAGGLAGASCLYALGRWAGRPLLLRYARLLRLSPGQVERAQGWFERRGAWAVAAGRMVPGLRTWISVPPGAARMSYPRYLAYSALGIVAWDAALIGAGALLGARWSRLAALVERLGVPVAGSVALAGLILWWGWRRLGRGHA